MREKILLVEDDISISEMVQNYLVKEGFSIVTAFDGVEAVEKFLKESFNLIVLDIMMPKLDGIEVIKIIRNKSMIPILIMSAKDSDVDKAIGLGFGADDYIAKPFSMIEFSARVKAAIRRATKYSNADKKEEKKIININELLIDLDNFLVSKNGVGINLTSKEFEILKLFATHPSRVFTKAQIYSFVWNDDYFGDDNVINVHMRRLREKIEDNPSQPKYIKTLWGIGYKLGEF
ncbi:MULTISPECIES: response regulator transcription factor [unclassified Clostridium]|uniref:response regulator transcription factor n=1 Tax=unclassified Clostridium TaxID=2614128 RepID=UPI0002984EAF|nr:MULTISPECIES: response regulator transcription factor [unclassified Clostridium]EKQ57428.1 MAG: response regulator (CheY-like receiver and winged helix DNA-binding domain containing protein) [Clostridium sp. Maddingley MBC34-26]